MKDNSKNSPFDTKEGERVYRFDLKNITKDARSLSDMRKPGPAPLIRGATMGVRGPSGYEDVTKA